MNTKIHSNQSYLAHLVLFIVALIYGANYSIAKIVLDPKYIQPNGFILLRIWSAVILFIVFFGPLKRIEKSDFRLLIVCALSGVLCNQLFFFNGLSLTSPIHAALIMVCTPMLVLIMRYFKGFPLSPTNIFGCILGFFGAAWLILSSKNGHGQNSSALGDIYILINALSYGYYLIQAPKLIQKYGPFETMKWLFLIGGICCIPFGIHDLVVTQWTLLDRDAWLALIFVLICTTFLAYALNAFALQLSHSSLVSNYIYLQPFIASIIAIWLGKDFFQWRHLFIGIIIITGVFLSDWKGKKLMHRN